MVVATVVSPVLVNAFGVSTDIANGLLAVVSVICMIGYWQKEKISYLALFLIGANIALSIASGRFGATAFTILLVIYFIVKKGYAKNHLCLFVALMAVAFFGMFILYYFIGFNSFYNKEMWRDSAGEYVLRQSLGFLNANQAMLFWAATALAAVNMVNDSSRKATAAFLLVLTCLFYTQTGSRTTMLVLGVILALFFLLGPKTARVAPRWVIACIAIMPFALLLFSFALAYLNDVDWINRLFSGRPRIYANALQLSGVSAFGSSAIEKMMFDNGYLHALLSKGAVFAVMFFSLLAYIFAHEKRITVGTALFAGGFYAINVTETAFLNFIFLVPLVLLLERDNLLLDRTLEK